MGRSILTFQPRTTGALGGIDYNDIPEDLRTEFEQVYQALKDRVGSFYVKFDSLGEKNEYVQMGHSWAGQRPEGAVKFHSSPVKGRPKDSLELNFTIKDIKSEGDGSAKEIREAVDKVKEATNK